MCKCNKPINSPCGCRPKQSCQKDISTDSVVYDSNTALPCTGVLSGTPLTEVILAIDEKICSIQGDVQSGIEITNVGTGQGIYAGNTQQGAKKLKSLLTSPSINIVSTTNELSPQINQTWLNNFIDTATNENIVEFNTANPNNAGTIFNPATPTDPDALYWSNVDNSNWKYNSTNNNFTPAANNGNTTPFYLTGTTNDAGGNKLANIYRLGRMGIGTNSPITTLHISGGFTQSQSLNAIVKSNSSGTLVSAVAGTDYLTPTGSAAGLTNFPTLNQNTTGNAATVTTNANLTGDVTSIGNATTLSPSGVTAGTYLNANVTVDAKGRVTSITNGGGMRTLRDFLTPAINNSSAETILYDYTLPGGTLNVNGEKLMIKYSGRLLNAGDNKTLTVLFGGAGGSHIFNTTLAGGIVVDVMITRLSANTVNQSITFHVGTTVEAYSETYSASSWTNDKIIQLKVTAPAGSTSMTAGTIMYIPAVVV